MNIKLADLNPIFVSHGGEGITNSKTGEPVPYSDKIGINFDCPCGNGERVFIAFENPVHGAPPIETKNHTWKRKGEEFETMSLTPSIRRMDKCKWNGFLTDGEFIACADSGR